MNYRDIGLPNYLELAMSDGRPKGVCFVEDEASRNALRAGRCELDRIAIERGLLPVGSSFVSRQGVGREPGLTSGDAAGSRQMVSGTLLGFPDDDDFDPDDFITPEKDATAREVRPTSAGRYHSLVDALQAERGSSTHLAFALIVDALDGGVEGDPDRGAIRSCCSTHPDPTRGLYISGGGTRFHCFSCGAGGTEVDWLVLRHGISRMEAGRIVASRR